MLQRGRKAKGENKDWWISKAGFLPSCFCLPPWCPRGAVHVPRAVGMLLLFRSSASSQHSTVSGVNTNNRALLNPPTFVWLLPSSESVLATSASLSPADQKVHTVRGACLNNAA